MKSFDFYEFAGLLVPGTVVLFVIVIGYPESREPLLAHGFSVGYFGVFTVLAYATGHLIQAFGNLWEIWWWKLFGGMPTDWIRTCRAKEIMGEDQEQVLVEAVNRMLEHTEDLDLSRLSNARWQLITREIYVFIQAVGNTSRIDLFSAGYGLNRGIASAMLVALILVLSNSPNFQAGFLLLFGFVLAIYRMHRFGTEYARELFTQFLQVSRRTDRLPTNKNA